MQIVGITGGIGSGKSTIARELAQRGYTVYDCDREAKRIITSDQRVRAAIIELLGERSFEDGRYNTEYVSQRVFGEPTLLERLNAIVHPAVKQDIQSSAAERSGVMFIESAILFEAGLDSLCNKIIVVEAPEELRLARTVARDYNGAATPDVINKVRARMCCQQSAAQRSSAYKNATVLMNDGNTSVAELAQRIVHSL